MSFWRKSRLKHAYICNRKKQDWSKYGLNFVFAISVVSGTYELALITMVYVYWKIAQVIRSQNRRIENSHNSNSITNANVSRHTVHSLTRKFNTHKGVITSIDTDFRISIMLVTILFSAFLRDCDGRES